MRLRTITCGLLAAGCLALWTSASGTTPVVRGKVTYYFDHPYHIDAADSTLRATHNQLQNLLQRQFRQPVDVYLVADPESFDSLIGGQFPDWGAAAAIPMWRRIVIKSPDAFPLSRSLAHLLAHEYAHLALAERTGLNPAPRWFEEGLAQMVSMQWSWTDNLRMNMAALTGDFVPLHEIEGVNRFGQSKAHLAYSESYLTVTYMFETYGIDAVNIFLDAIADGESVDDALMASTGSNYEDFEQEAKDYLYARFNLAGLMADTMYLWLGLAVVVIVGYFLYLRRRRRYYRKWAEEEKYHSTDFDYGDPDRPEEIDDDEPWRQ